MRRVLLGMPAFALLLLAMPAAAQDDRGTVPEVGQDVERGEDPVIIDRSRGPRQGENDETIRSELESFVQIQGAWASDEAACATIDENGGGGLYLTDTIVRWEDATCNIRDVDAEEASATIYAFCVGEEGRRERTFDLELAGQDKLSLSFQAGGEQEEIELTRCAESR